MKMKLVESSIAGLFTSAVANRRLRSAAMQLAHAKIRERSLGERAGDCPAGIKEEKYYMVRNLLNAVDRALDMGNISPRVRRGVFESLLKNNLLGRGREKKKLFAETYGIEPPAFLTISPTRVCNLRCRGCYAGSTSAFRETLPFDVFDRIITEKTDNWGSYFTVISGGEPLMYRESGRDLFDLAARHSNNFFLMYTNGTLIDSETARRMSDVGNITPAISVEGFEKETDARRGRGTYAKILKAFENLRGAGVPFGLSLTATRENSELVTSEELMDFYINGQGAMYAWIFHYMPIGRSFALEMMVTPEQRVRMLEKTRKLVRSGYFVADFWNGGPASYGCISGGRKDGYIYIIWDGSVTPCVFVPYSADNIHDVYSRGGTLNDVLFSPLFKGIRKWQEEYSLKKGPKEMGNLIRPCPIRDHHAVMRKLVDETSANPIDEDAAESLKDEDYYRGLVAYGEKVGELTEGIWQKEYLRS